MSCQRLALAIALFAFVAAALRGADEKPYDYAAIDNLVQATPKQAEKSVAALAAYFKNGAKNDREKARAAYMWIAENVTLDLEGLVNGRFEQRPALVLKTRKSDWVGLARLYEAIARSSGLEVAFIPGKLKHIEVHPSYGLRFGKQSPNGVVYDNHAWNAVKIDKQWQFVDVSLAASQERLGWLDNAKRTSTAYFLVPPRELIWTHLPDDVKWQQIEKPYKLQDHTDLAILERSFFLLGCEPGDPKECSLKVAEEAKVTFGMPNDLVLYATLLLDGKQQDNGYTFIQRAPKEIEVRAIFPKAGTYTLRLFCRKGEAKDAPYDWLADYRIEAKKAREAKFPTPFLMFKQKGGYVHTPLTDKLPRDKPQQFKVSIPEASRVAVRTGGQFVFLEKKDDLWVGEVPLKAGEVVLMAEFPGMANMLHGMVKYIAE